MKKNCFAIFSCLALAILIGPVSAETFDFTIGADDWSGNVDSTSVSGNYQFNNMNADTVNGFIMQLAANGDLVMFHDGTSDPDHVTTHPIKSVFTVQDASDANQTFVVDSLDWTNNPGAPDEATLAGYSGGVGGALEWTISGAGATNVTAATSGTLSNPIDTLVWEAPNYQDQIFGSKLDNVNFSIVPEPASLLLALIGGLAFYTKRRMA